MCRRFRTFVLVARRWCLGIIVAALLIASASVAMADQSLVASSPSAPSGRPSTVTLGIAYGSSLLGFDREFPMNDRVALQFGAGLIGADASINYHVRRDIRSSYVSLGLWDLGLLGDYMGLVSTCYGIRGKHLTGQLGVGFRAFTGGNAKWVHDAGSVYIVTSLGWYWVH